MAAFKFIRHFGRVGVWQLAATDRNGHHRKAAAEDLRSRTCFTGWPTHGVLNGRVANGGLMEKTQITEVFDYAKFQQNNPGAIVMFLQDARGFNPAPPDLAKIPAGTTIYALLAPPDPAG